MTDDEPPPFDPDEHSQHPAPPPAQPLPPLGDANRTTRDDPPPPRPAAPARPEPAPEELDRLGANLARAMQEGAFHPVVLFGTNFSGKTSLLMSLFASLAAQPKLEAGLALCDPVLGSGSRIGRLLHEDAVHTFEVKTQAFMEGEQILKTAVSLPFFIPVEFRPTGKPSVRFAFLESSGEWYRPLRDRGAKWNDVKQAYPGLRAEIEDFISNFQGPITFLYLLPYTQGDVYTDKDNPLDSDEIGSASLAIRGVIESYDKIRATHRGDDFHLMLVTKWDAHDKRNPDRAGAVEEDRTALIDFCNERYAQAMAAFQGLEIDADHRSLNAYCAGIMGTKGRLPLKSDAELASVVLGYPIRLWRWLYRNALYAEELPPQDPFPTPPEPPFLVRAWNRILEFVSGR